jgi:hypothetical protein
MAREMKRHLFMAWPAADAAPGFVPSQPHDAVKMCAPVPM